MVQSQASDTFFRVVSIDVIPLDGKNGVFDFADMGHIEK